MTPLRRRRVALPLGILAGAACSVLALQVWVDGVPRLPTLRGFGVLFGLVAAATLVMLAIRRAAARPRLLADVALGRPAWRRYLAAVGIVLAWMALAALAVLAIDRGLPGEWSRALTLAAALLVALGLLATVRPTSRRRRIYPAYEVELGLMVGRADGGAGFTDAQRRIGGFLLPVGFGLGAAGVLLPKIGGVGGALGVAATVLSALVGGMGLAMQVAPRAFTRLGRRRGPARTLEHPAPPKGRPVPRPWRLGRARTSQQSDFRGRERELRLLIEEHDRQRRARRPGRRLLRRRPPGRDEPDASGSDDRTAAGAIVLLIHGKPSVGKSALARELAGRLAKQYARQFYVNMGTVGGAKPTGEILKEFLDRLGWPEEKMPVGSGGRERLFRSLTARARILFILDAARQHDQVLPVLPTGIGCAVIVTSRRDLGPALGARSLSLDTPDVPEALDILRAVSRTGDWERPVCAAEIIELCGRLPLAIRSAGERVSRDGNDLCQVADLLRPPGSRLDWLGRGVEERIATEYQRLTHKEQRALCLLTLVDAPTFVPWVLRPLLDAKLDEAENLVAQLARAQLLDTAGQDETSGLARYAFNPLVRLFVSAQLARLPAKEVQEARARLVNAYIEVIGWVLAELEHGFVPPDRTQAWYSIRGQLHQRIAEGIEGWVRKEYLNLLHVITEALQRSDCHGLAWRVAARLGGCVQVAGDPEECLRVFRAAKLAAEEEGCRRGRVEVLLAEGSFLVALERYPRALATLTHASRRAQALVTPAAGEEERRAAQALQASAMRRIGEAWLQMDDYRKAAHALELAALLAETAGHDDERQLIRVLQAETHQVLSLTPDYGIMAEDRLNDNMRFRTRLAYAEADRRRGDWESAAEHLHAVMSSNDGDDRRAATVQYRLSRLYLNRALGVGDHLDEELALASRSTDGARGGLLPEKLARRLARRRARQQAQVLLVTRLADTSVRYAAQAALIFRRLGNPVGAVRARCVLARALLIAGRPVEAEQVASTAERELADLAAQSGGVDHAGGPLAARVVRTRGALMLRQGNLVGGRRLLAQAAARYAEHGDWVQQRAVLRLLDAHDRATELPLQSVDAGLAGEPAPTGRAGREEPVEVWRLPAGSVPSARTAPDDFPTQPT